MLGVAAEAEQDGAEGVLPVTSKRRLRLATALAKAVKAKVRTYPVTRWLLFSMIGRKSYCNRTPTRAQSAKAVGTQRQSLETEQRRPLPEEMKEPKLHVRRSYRFRRQCSGRPNNLTECVCQHPGGGWPL